MTTSPQQHDPYVWLTDRLQYETVALLIVPNEGVIAPRHLLQEKFVIEVAYDMPVPIHDLTVTPLGQGDNDGVTGIFSFGRQPKWCRFPWHSIVAMRGRASDKAIGLSVPRGAPAVAAAGAVAEVVEDSPEVRRMGFRVLRGGLQ